MNTPRAPPEYVEYLKARYAEHPEWIAEQREWVARFGIRGRILDAGSGLGHLAVACKRAGSTVLGVERDHALLFAGRDVTGFGEAACGDVVALPFRSSSFDWVLSNQVVEHLSDPAAFLRECSRVLVPSGNLFLTTPNRRSHLATRRPAKLWAALQGRAKSDPTHVHEFVAGELSSLLERSGFVIRHREAVGRLSRSRFTRFFAGGVLVVASRR